MAFEHITLLLIALPVIFGLGWLAAKLDSRQWQREQRSAPKAYFKGLNLLLNEQQDKAIDAFIEAVQADPDTSELHFALGNLFRRRGEFERAVRVHQHLLQRGDLPAAERERAQYALAQDFFKAGIFDRAETALRALEGTRFASEAELALLSLYERSRDWAKAAEVARHLEAAGTGSFASRIAHYVCEQALEAQHRQQDAQALALLAEARRVAPSAARAYVLTAQLHALRQRPADAVAAYNDLVSANPEALHLVARDFALAAQQAQLQGPVRETLLAVHRRLPGLQLLQALALLDEAPESQRRGLSDYLREEPNLGAARQLLQLTQTRLTDDEVPLVAAAIDRAARPLQRYRCASCGFESQHYFWQCPGCLSWDSYPPRHVEEL